MLTYNQKTGELFKDGVLLATGYSGNGPGRNNPMLEAVRSVGPIPRGRYQIGPGYTTKSMGPLSIPLTPIGHGALGRSGFFIHGDSKDGNASHGCIILGRSVRQKIAGWRKLGEELEVVTGTEQEKTGGPAIA